MSAEFGIFALGEGMTEGGFFSKAEADSAFAKWPEEEKEGCYVAEICHDHEEQEKDCCEECNSEEDEGE